MKSVRYAHGGPYAGYVIKPNTLKFSVRIIKEERCPKTNILIGKTEHYWRGRYIGSNWIGEVHSEKRVSLNENILGFNL